MTVPQSTYLFATPVLTTMIENFGELNDRLKPLIYGQEKIDTGLQKSNFGGWHSKDDMMGWAAHEARDLIQAAIATFAPYTTDVHPAGKRDFEFDANMWANINRKGDANNSHTHPGCLWSCVYYVDDGTNGSDEYVGGELMLEDPRFPMNVMYVPSLVLKDENGVAQKSQHAIRAKTGRLVVFPAWLRHSVRPYLGDNDRISVAFNLMVNEASPDF